MFECSGSNEAPLQTVQRERVLSGAPSRNRRHEKTKGARCQGSWPPDSSREDARARPTGGGKARLFHLYRGSDPSRHGPEPSRAGRKGIGTTYSCSVRPLRR